jgi:hypothetical protein
MNRPLILLFVFTVGLVVAVYHYGYAGLEWLAGISFKHFLWKCLNEINDEREARIHERAEARRKARLPPENGWS